MRIVTNNYPRALRSWCELTKHEQTEFDHLTEEEANNSSFFRYKWRVYSLSDFMRDGTPDGWHGSYGQSYFEAILVKLVDDETIIVGRAFA